MCLSENCIGKPVSRGHCSTHYHKLWKSGAFAKNRDRAPKRCSVEDCDLAFKKRGYCGNHYQAARNAGEFSDCQCSMEGCVDVFYAKKLCRYHYTVERRYSISLVDYQKLLVEQNFSCKICGRKETTNLSIDHDHVTQEVRGLLCRSCNLGIANFDDNVDRLKSAIVYLSNS